MLYRIIITSFGIGGIAYGYHLQSFMQTVLVLAAGFAVAALVRISNRSLSPPQSQ